MLMLVGCCWRTMKSVRNVIGSFRRQLEERLARTLPLERQGNKGEQESEIASGINTNNTAN